MTWTSDFPMTSPCIGNVINSTHVACKAWEEGFENSLNLQSHDAKGGGLRSKIAVIMDSSWLRKQRRSWMYSKRMFYGFLVNYWNYWNLTTIFEYIFKDIKERIVIYMHTNPKFFKVSCPLEENKSVANFVCRK